MADTTRSAIHSSLLPAVTVGSIAVLLTAVVLYYGWIADDAYITARYAHNLIHGLAPVFNEGERVQGYTHPLWLLLFAGGLAILGEPLLVAVTLGALFSLLSITVLGRALLTTVSLGRAFVVLALFATLLALSDSWRSFQTSGLENSLTNFLLALVVVEVVRREADGTSTLKLTCCSSLLTLSRPDLLLVVAPLCCLALLRAVRKHQIVHFVGGLLPAALWFAFAQLYSGTPIPNTVTDKVGIYTLSQGIERGLIYLLDFAIYEPASLLAMVALSFLVISTRPTMPTLLLLFGIALYVAALVLAGGDFMRGRILTPVLFTIAALALFHASDMFRSGVRMERGSFSLLALAAVFIALWWVAPTQDGAIRHGIVNERRFYEGQSLRHYIRTGEAMQANPGLAMIDDLRLLRDACGPLTVGIAHLGAFSYELGPDFEVIDYLGLTDRYIATLPKASLVEEPRPGHPVRWIPVSYLASRGDVALFSNWQESARSGDCRILSALEDLTSSPSLFNPSDPSTRPTYTPSSVGD